MSIVAPGSSLETFTPDRLIAGDAVGIVTRDVTIVSGAGALVRGTVLGQITTGGKYKTSLSASEDGSEDPVAILADDVDATSADKVAPIYEAGEFNSAALTIGTGHSLATIRASLRALGIHIKTAQPA